MKRKVYTNIIFGIVFFIMTFSLILQTRTIKNIGTLTLDSYGNERLIEEIFKWKYSYENISKRLKEQENLILDYENSKNSQNKDEVLNKEVVTTKAMLGAYNLRGEGIIIYLDDSSLQPNEELNLSVKDLVVHDTNILHLINELNELGAEAISVNDQRIIYSSEIKCIGPVIRINKERVASPFIVKVIGNKDDLYDGLNKENSIVSQLRERTLKVYIEKGESIFIPKYNEII